MSSSTITDRGQWQVIMRQQRLANAKRWLSLLERSDDPTSLVTENYDNLLLALETTLQSNDTFDLAFELTEALFPAVAGFADWDRWLIYIKKLLHTSQYLNRKQEEVRLLELSGRLLSYTGDLEQAEQTFLKAGHLYNQQNDMAGYAHVLALLATIFNQHGKTTEAVELCQEALEIAETMSDDILVANINLSLSDIYIRGRNWREGLVAAQKAYTIYQNTEAPRYVTQALINLFAIWATLEEWKEIESHTGELLNLLAESGEIHRLSQLKNNLGIAAYNQNNYVKAESEWQEALQLHSQIQEPSELASLYNNLGLVYTKTGEWEAALEMLQKSVGAFKKLGDVFRWANSLDNLADLYEAQGNTAASRQALKEAITGLKSIDPSPPTQELLSEMEAHLARLAKA